MKKVIVLIFIAQAIFAHSATILVTNTNDSGAGSFRQAAADANMGDIIRFDPSLIAGGSDTIFFASPVLINKGLFIKGVYNSTDTLFFSGAGVSRMIDINIISSSTFANVDMDSLVFINGYSIEGGALKYTSDYNPNARLYFRHCLFRDNSSDKGGAIYSYKTSGSTGSNYTCNITLEYSTFKNNSSSYSGSYGGGGAIFVYRYSSTTGYAVGIDLEVTGCNFLNNTSSARGGAIYAYTYAYAPPSTGVCNIDVTHSSFIENEATHLGGALYVYSWGNTRCEAHSNSSTWAGNVTIGSGGACYLESVKDVLFDSDFSTFYGNTAYIDGSALCIKSDNTDESRIESYGSIFAANGGNLNYQNTIYQYGLDVPFSSSCYNLFDFPQNHLQYYQEYYPDASDDFDQTLAQIYLAPLALNPNGTYTMVPMDGSVAVNAGPGPGGIPQNAPCLGVRDIGAAESPYCYPVPVNQTASICSGVSYNFYGQMLDTTGTYTHTIVSLGACDSIVTLNLTVSPSPSLSFAANPIFTCTGTSIPLTNTPTGNIVSYAWSPSATLDDAAASIPVASPTANTTYSYIVTTAENCSAAGTISVSLYAAPSLNIVQSSLTTCLGSNVSVTGTGNADTYLWSPATDVNSPSSMNTTITPTVTTTYVLTGTESQNGCTAKDSITITIGNIFVNSNNATISCGGSATLTATPQGNYVTPLTYSWTPTTDLSTSTGSTVIADPNVSTTYFVTVSTANGCSGSDNSVVTVTPSNFNVNFSSSTQLLSSPPFVAQFSNSTPNLSNYTFTWHWGDGNSTLSNNTTVFHTYQFNGNYDVTLVAVNNNTGCSDTMFQGGYIFCSGGTGCSLTATVATPEGITDCIGDSILLTCNTDPAYTYQWSLNGTDISGATNSSFYASITGNYAVTITEGICTALSIPVLLSFVTAPVPATITPNGNINLCGGGSVFLTASSGYPTYLWNTGATTQNITVSESGVYTVTVSNGSGCTSTTSYSLNASSLDAPEICMVGVDSLTGNNLIIWDKAITLEIDSFVVYREGIVANQFDRIGAQAYGDFSTFLDINSNPQQQSYRYELSIIDTCGVETLLSDFHKTIHLTINYGVGSSWNLIWNLYEGLSIPTYNIYRGTSPNTMSLLTSVSGNNSSFTDLTPPPGLVYYQIEAIHPFGGCDPTLKQMNYLTSFSNLADNASVGIAAQIQKNEVFSLYPNPTTGLFNIDFASQNDRSIKVYNALGALCYERNLSGKNNQLDLNYLENGVYFVEIEFAGTKTIQKVVIKK